MDSDKIIRAIKYLRANEQRNKKPLISSEEFIRLCIRCGVFTPIREAGPRVARRFASHAEKIIAEQAEERGLACPYFQGINNADVCLQQ